ncbi:MAG TPA: hypothetical protein VE689_10870 [Candidatus Udaeobacter sp.]|jgi:hypothetical protein|nr:hypothetical protein [Candidatus Udaeobacter sp.]
MAGDDLDRSRGVAGRIAQQDKAQPGLLGFLASNILWVIWGVYAHAYALVVFQVILAVLNLRGVQKNDPDSSLPLPDA